MAAGSLTAISKRTQMTTLSSRLSVISRVGSGALTSHTTHDANSSTAGDLGALRQQYRMPLSPYPHAPPLEMTIAAGSFTVISKRTQMTTLPSRLSVVSRVGSGVLKSPSTHDTTVTPHLCHFERSKAESRNLTPQWHKPLWCRRSLDSPSNRTECRYLHTHMYLHSR